MFDDLMVLTLQNPIFLGAIIGIVRSIGGYIYNCIEAKKLLPYSATELLTTLGLWETVFITAAGFGGLSSTVTVVLAFGLDFIRSLKKAIESYNQSKGT